MSFYLFLVIIAYRIACINRTHTVCDTAKICDSFSQRCLSASAVPQQRYISDLVCDKNLHTFYLPFFSRTLYARVIQFAVSTDYQPTYDLQ